MKKILAYLIAVALVVTTVSLVPVSNAKAASDKQASSGAKAVQDTAKPEDSSGAKAAQDTAKSEEPIEVESYGKMDEKSGTFLYDQSAVTVPRMSVQATGLPAKYDLRDEGRVTSVKDQYPNEYCWAFAAIASLESNLITKKIATKSIDCSEGHLGWFGLNGRSESTVSKYAGRDTCISFSQKSNYYVAAATLARGYGAVKESDMPYSLLAKHDTPPAQYLTEAKMTKSTYELQDAIFVSANTTTNKYDKAAFDTVKQLIMKNGAVASKIAFPDEDQWVSSFGSNKPPQLIACYDTKEIADHAITIVGWDDNYNDFKGEKKPAGPGAWIVKNSYGTDIHKKGYFYLSYYTPSVSQFVSFTAQKNSGRQIYQYDGVGIGDMILKASGAVSGINCYKARTDVMLDQMMAFTPQANCQVNCRIYINRNGASPASGVKLYDKTFKQKYGGYSRTNLGKKIGIPKGAKFYVRVTVKTPENDYFIPFELKDLNDPGTEPAVVKGGQSWLFQDGKWTDVDKTTKLQDDDGSAFRLYNAQIKVFGKKSGAKKQKIKVKTKRKMKKGKKLKLKAKRTKGSGKLVYRSSNLKKATVSKRGVVKAKKKGTVKITVYALPTTTYKSAKKVVKIKIK